MKARAKFMKTNYIKTDKIELKEEIDDYLPKDIEAFLNTYGGAIIIGVSDDEIPVGVGNTDETLRRILGIISDQIEPNAIDCIKVAIIYEGDKILIKVVINKGYGSLYCMKKYGFSPNGCHYRAGTTCKSMTLEMIRKAFEKSLSDVDLMIKIPSYYGDIKFEKLKLMLLESGFHLDDSSYEKNLKLRNLDGEYNLLAELLSDTNRFSFIFAKFKGKTKADYSERSDYGNQCIVLAYMKMKERLMLENICKTITNPRPRRDICLYDMDAVNEALVNAVIHNDYRMSEPQVSFFDDRLEIISHGGLPIGLTKEEFFSGISRPRNAHLMDIFKRLGIVEHTGHGVPTIIAKYGKEAFDIKNSYINIIIPFNKEVLENHGSVSNSMPEKLESTDSEIGSSTPDNSLDDKERLILDAIKENPSVTIKELSQKLSLPFRSTQRYVATLKEKGRIYRNGSTKKGNWEIK